MHSPISPRSSLSLTATLAATTILLSGLRCNAFRMSKPSFGCWSRLYSNTEIETGVPNDVLNSLTDDQVFHDFPPSFDEETGEISSPIGQKSVQEVMGASATPPAVNDQLLEAVKRQIGSIPPPPSDGESGVFTSEETLPRMDCSPATATESTNEHNLTTPSGVQSSNTTQSKRTRRGPARRYSTQRRERTVEYTVGLTGGSLESDMRIASHGRPKLTAKVRETGYDSMGNYMKTVCNHELLNRNEEVILAREIQILMKWEEARAGLEANLGRRPSYAEWATAVRDGMTVTEMKKQIRRSLRAKAALMASNVRLVVHIAKRYQQRGVPLQDLSQEGIIGLSRACEKFDPERGFRFSTYASWWIRQGIQKGIQHMGSAIRIPANVVRELNKVRKAEKELHMLLGHKPNLDQISEHSGIRFERLEFLKKVSRRSISTSQEIQARSTKGSGASTGGTQGSAEGSTMCVEDTLSDRGDSPADMASYDMLKDDVSRLVCTLNRREQAVIKMRFGLNGCRSHTLEEVGRHFSVTRERIRQVEARALHKLRQPYRNQAVKSYLDDYS